jgi:putative PIN family toxin of toxin-antitoxin system
LRSERLTACVDANVLISAVAFGGKPLDVLGALLARRFASVSSPQLLAEVRRNLVDKLVLRPATADSVVAQIHAVSVMVRVAAVVPVTGHAPDDAVLATAVEGHCDVLVTGDKKHLLPLKRYGGVTIEGPTAFLSRLERP